MTTKDLIEHIKALSPSDREKVAEFVQQIESEQKEVRYADDKACEDAAQEIVNHHSDLLRKLAK